MAFTSHLPGRTSPPKHGNQMVASEVWSGIDPSTLPATSGQGVPESLCHLIYSVRRDAEHAVDVERMVLRAVGVVKLRNEG